MTPSEAQAIEAFGGFSAWRASLPARHWIPTASGGWCSHARTRCTDNCEEGLEPLDDEAPEPMEDDQ